MEKHTLKYMKGQSESKLFDRNTRDDWKLKGSKDLNQRTDEEACRILESHKLVPLSSKVADRLKDIIDHAEKEYLKK